MMSIGTSYQAVLYKTRMMLAFEWRRSNYFDNRVVSILSEATYLFIYAMRKLQECRYLFVCISNHNKRAKISKNTNKHSKSSQKIILQNVKLVIKL